MKHIIQGSLRRGRHANRLGLFLFAALLLVLLMAVLQGVAALHAA